MSVTISGDTGVSAVQDGVIVQADLATAILPLGVGQTWQDVKTTPGRAFNTDYTNSTGQPIQVNVVCAIENGDGAALIVSSLVVGYCAGYSGLTGGMYQSMSALVPNGAVYRINSTATPTLNSWMELR
jgi:hypothetical protein